MTPPINWASAVHYQAAKHCECIWVSTQQAVPKSLPRISICLGHLAHYVSGTEPHFTDRTFHVTQMAQHKPVSTFGRS